MKRSVIVGGVLAGAVVLVLAGVAWWLVSADQPRPAAPTTAASSTVTPSAQPAVDLPTAVERQLHAYADACTQPATTVPDHCGIVIPWAADLAELTGVAFRIEQRPTVAISPDSSSFDATGGVLVATVTGTTRDGATATFTYRTDTWTLRGDIDDEDGRIVVSVR
ncbi:hypothetical protein IF188_11760 [Microbacterium sp. NEAU-LLC]|uniref:Uncharacterized protein n=1 Tax=Microbacterium helvum TaxID=2773713 RepID=A0ABR8NNZ5_9MICO|nr:hypothetical protein [Microbacterium helvum]MBD3942375.1 hypothetical protein [Microbacterium helvum]